MKRTLALSAAWLASAAAAVGLGFLAVSLVGASASPGTSPVAATSSSATEPTEVAAPTTAPTATGEQATVAGTVYANCTAGTPVLAGVPVAGWQVDDSAAAGEVEFRSATQKVEVRVVCTGGSPQFSVEGPRSDNSGRDDSATPTPAEPVAPASPSASDDSGRDDSSGRGGGGHGSDDSGSGSGSGSDDSSGRGGGGHGSDG